MRGTFTCYSKVFRCIKVCLLLKYDEKQCSVLVSLACGMHQSPHELNPYFCRKMAQTVGHKLLFGYPEAEYVAQCARNVLKLLKPGSAIIVKNDELRKYLAQMTRRVDDYAVVIGGIAIDQSDCCTVQKWLAAETTGHLQLALSSTAAHEVGEMDLKGGATVPCGCRDPGAACLSSLLYPESHHLMVLLDSARDCDNCCFNGAALGQSVSRLHDCL